MGRNKIRIGRISNDRVRQVTLYKRRKGLLKKSMELSLLCEAQVLLCVFDKHGKMMIYASQPETTGTIFQNFTKDSVTKENFSNSHYAELFENKKNKNKKNGRSQEGNEEEEEEDLDSLDFDEEELVVTRQEAEERRGSNLMGLTERNYGGSAYDSTRKLTITSSGESCVRPSSLCGVTATTMAPSRQNSENLNSNSNSNSNCNSNSNFNSNPVSNYPNTNYNTSYLGNNSQGVSQLQNQNQNQNQNQLPMEGLKQQVSDFCLQNQLLCNMMALSQKNMQQMQTFAASPELLQMVSLFKSNNNIDISGNNFQLGNTLLNEKRPRENLMQGGLGGMRNLFPIDNFNTGFCSNLWTNQ